MKSNTFSNLPLAEPSPCQEEGGPDTRQGLSPMRRMQAGGSELSLHEHEQVRHTLSKPPVYLWSKDIILEWPVAEAVPGTLGAVGS